MSESARQFSYDEDFQRKNENPLDKLVIEGTGYRMRTRFAKFFNLPELMSMFREVADVKTSDQLKLPVPEAVYHNVVAQPTETQKMLVKDLSERAVQIHNGFVTPTEDNMLKVTSDGRKLGLDQRIISTDYTHINRIRKENIGKDLSNTFSL